MADENQIDALLKGPLPEVADDGFSRAISAKITVTERNGMWLELGAATGVVAILSFFLPTEGVLRLIAGVSENLSTSLPFAAACATIALTYAALRAMAE